MTLPGRFNASRYAQACYRKMGVDDLITKTAEDYIKKAVILGRVDNDLAVYSLARYTYYGGFSPISTVNDAELCHDAMNSQTSNGIASRIFFPVERRALDDMPKTTDS